MTEATPQVPQLDELIALFYSDPSELGEFRLCLPQHCPVEYRRMLAHTAHMTVTVEHRHGCPVSVEVLAEKSDENFYERKILLRRDSDHRVVQYGIVRLSLSALSREVRDEILSGDIPLGRVLIKHNVLRHVQLSSLWQLNCAAELASYFGVEPGHETYGRTALIYCDGNPAVELLEIVAPENTF